MHKQFPSKQEFEELVKTVEKLKNLVGSIVDHNKKSLDHKREIFENEKHISAQQFFILEFLVKRAIYVARALQIIFLIQILIIIDLYLKDYIGQLIPEFIISRWDNLSEAWKIFIIGIPIYILSEIPIYYIKKLLQNGRK